MPTQKPFLQVFPGQNDPRSKPQNDKQVDPKEWERRQRLKEYRIAARREKRNRKSDEKKQRKLNATILRRMTRNPLKYTKNAGRNRLRAIEQERRKIQGAAMQMVQRLAAVYDPSGKMFNIKPVVTLEDGRVVSVEAVERKKHKEAERAREHAMRDAGPDLANQLPPPPKQEEQENSHGINEDRLKLLTEQKFKQTQKNLSTQLNKAQQRKAAQFEPRPPLSKPVIPEGIDPPSDEEEDWLALWDLGDDELERRVTGAKKRAAKARKELRQKQKSGKAERRAARDEKRLVYREIKLSWKKLREDERRRRKFLISMEDEESKRLAVKVTELQRKCAMDLCAQLGFTLENVAGVDEIKPRISGMKGKQVSFDKLELVGERPSGLKVKDEKPREKTRGNRVDLGAVPDESMAIDFTKFNDAADPSMDANFIKLGFSEAGQDFEAINYNHKVRRKLRRALETAQVNKELLVRKKAIEHCEENGIEIDPILYTPTKPKNIRGQRTMPNGQLESAKQERTRAKVELAEYNRWAKILRQQAKDQSIEAGIRIYLELMERIPKREGWDAWIEQREAEKLKTAPNDDEQHLESQPIGGIWPAQSSKSMADILTSWEVPKDPNAGGEDGDITMFSEILDDNEPVSSEDSASKQLRREMRDSQDRMDKSGGTTDDEDNDSESDDSNDSED